jgi:hypothetical protein
MKARSGELLDRCAGVWLGFTPTRIEKGTRQLAGLFPPSRAMKQGLMTDVPARPVRVRAETLA